MAVYISSYVNKINLLIII